MAMTPEQLEYAISQYVDGVLGPLERDVLERRLADDPQAQKTLEDYSRLQQALRSASSLPEVRWDRLAAHLSAAVAEQEMPVRHYPLRRRLVGGLAIAASLLLAVGITVRVYLATQEGIMSESGPTALVQVLTQDSPAGPVVQEISIGPSPVTAESRWLDPEGVLSRPSRIIIASARQPEQDLERLPFENL